MVVDVMPASAPHRMRISGGSGWLSLCNNWQQRQKQEEDAPLFFVKLTHTTPHHTKEEEDAPTLR